MKVTAVRNATFNMSTRIPNHRVVTRYRYQAWECWFWYWWNLLRAMGCWKNVLIVARPCSVEEMCA